jgi:hypothetical protein
MKRGRTDKKYTGFAGFIVRYTWAYLLFFVLCIVPIFLFAFDPVDDIRYHFSGGEPRFITAEMAGSIRNNEYACMTGRIRIETVRPCNDGLFDDNPSFLFLLEGYPDTCVVHLHRGALHRIIRDYYMKQWDSEFSERLTNIRNGVSDPDSYEEKNLAAALSSPIKVMGRVYHNAGVFEPFGNYRYADIFDINEYYTDIGFPSKIRGSYERNAERGVNNLIARIMRASGESEEKIKTELGDDEDTRNVVILSVEESPRPSNLGDTNAPVAIVFLVMFITPLMLSLICFIIKQTDRR